MTVLETDRLVIGELSADADMEFIFELLNEPTFQQFIGDKKIHDHEAARTYINEGPRKQYVQHGYGLYRVGMKGDAVPVGICGLVRRDEFPDPDLGFAFLKDHWSNGYALESSLAVLRHSRETLGLTRIIALADKDNLASTKLLERLGFKFECKVTMPGETAEVCRYGIGN